MNPEKDWSRINDFCHSRLRNEYLFGSRDPHTQIVLDYVDNVPTPVETTWIPAVFTAIREIIDNSLDEIVRHKYGDCLDVTYDPETMIFTVEDNGRGVPINFDEEEQQYAATVLLSELKAGRNFGDRGESRGQNGIGGSCVNICSEYFQVDIHRDKKHFSQRFNEGDLTDLVREAPKITRAKIKTTGTRIEFKLSKHVFPNMTLPESFLRSRLLELAVCYPDLKVFYNGARIETKGSVEKTFFADLKPIMFNVSVEKFVSQFWLVPGFFENGIDVAHGLVNGIPTFDGGTHIDAFRNRFFSGLIEALSSQSKRRRLTPNKSDISDGMLIFNLTQMDAPTFNSQNKTRLINDDARKHVVKAMDDPDFFKRVIRSYPEWIESIYERCAARTRKADTATLADKKKLKKRVEDLSDACGTNRSKCILMLAEGASALSGIVEARDADIHGALPLRGKVANVHGMSIRDVLKEKTLCKIMNSIGLVPGEFATRASLRYNQVYITCDADEDGKDITGLLVNFFYTFWPELFDASKPPFLLVFDTPLIIAIKNKVRRYWYPDTVGSFHPEEFKGFGIVRAKGLAALTYDDWKILLKEPRLIPIVEDEGLKEALNLRFDEKRADDRKKWIGI